MKIRHAVQAVIFSDQEKEIKFLMIRKQDIKMKQELWRLVKGGVEEGETELQALKREIKEEVGLEKINILKKIHEYFFIFNNVRHEVSVYSVEADISEQVVLGQDNDFPFTDYKWSNEKETLKDLFWTDEKISVKNIL